MRKITRVLLALALMAGFVAVISGTAKAETVTRDGDSFIDCEGEFYYALAYVFDSSVPEDGAIDEQARGVIDGVPKTPINITQNKVGTYWVVEGGAIGPGESVEIEIQFLIGAVWTTVYTNVLSWAADCEFEPTIKAINANLAGYTCNSSEWHFVITQISSEALAPQLIGAFYTDGTIEPVYLESFSGGVAHYSTTSDLDKTLEKASAAIYLEWDGEFKLTQGPCGNLPTPADLVTLVDPTQGQWHMFNASGVETSSFFFGNPGDYPIMGDWNGDGVATPGMYRQSDGYVYLRNSNTQGVADIRFFFGDPGDVPIVGDFDGDGFDTVGIYRPSNQTFYIINELGANEGGLGAAEFSYVFGDPGDKPFVGDFDGDGEDTVGLHRESTGLVYFRNSHSQGNADAQFIFGDPGDRLVAGDWNGNGASSPALFRPGNMTMYFRYTNTQGNADNSWTAGMPSWIPVAGGR